MSRQVATSVLFHAPVQDLEAWAAATEQEIAEIRNRMFPLEEQLDAAKERLDLIRRLIGLAGANHAKAVRSTTESPEPGGRREGTQVPPGARVEDHIESVLSDAGQSLHISALRSELIARGVPLPGRGDEANIIVRLRRSEDRFTRTGRGMYGLASWGLPAVIPTRAKKKRGPRRVSK